MTIPERARPQRLGDYLAIVTRAVFQAGLSWKAIDAQWDDFVRLFDGFDPVLVAAYGDADVERIMADGAIVRSRKKIVATIANARALLEIERSATVADYLRSFPTYAALAADLRKRFAFLGELSAYYLVFRVGGAVPRFEAWETTIAGDHPRMREMVAHARERGYDETVALTAEEATMADRPETGKRSSLRKAPTTKTSSTKKSASRPSTAKRSTTKASAAKKTATKKTTAKKSTAKKSTTKKSTAKKATSKRKYGPRASAKVGRAMDEMKSGSLRSGRSGKKVTDRKQAIAIGLSEARREGADVPPAPDRKKKRS